MVRSYNQKIDRADYSAETVNTAVNLHKMIVTHNVKHKNNLVLTTEHLFAISKQDKPI